MSDGVKDTSIANKETDTDMSRSGNGNHSTELNNAKKFTVKNLAPELVVPSGKNSDGSAQSSRAQSPSPPSSGYATNEAIPMTVFYRQPSQGHSGKQRPTLQELRKGFENDKVREHLKVVNL